MIMEKIKEVKDRFLNTPNLYFIILDISGYLNKFMISRGVIIYTLFLISCLDIDEEINNKKK